MTKQKTYQRWLNYPHRKVERAQLLRTMRAEVGKHDPRYWQYKDRLDEQIITAQQDQEKI